MNFSSVQNKRQASARLTKHNLLLPAKKSDGFHDFRICLPIWKIGIGHCCWSWALRWSGARNRSLPAIQPCGRIHCWQFLKRMNQHQTEWPGPWSCVNRSLVLQRAIHRRAQVFRALANENFHILGWDRVLARDRLVLKRLLSACWILWKSGAFAVTYLSTLSNPPITQPSWIFANCSASYSVKTCWLMKQIERGIPGHADIESEFPAITKYI